MTENAPPEPVRGHRPTPHERALKEVGIRLLSDSVAAGRDFAKFMTGISTGAIPVYLSLVGLFKTADFSLSRFETYSLVAPVAPFLIAATVFAYGFLPTRGKVSIDFLPSIEDERRAVLDRQKRSTVWGMFFLALGIVLATAALARIFLWN